MLIVFASETMVQVVVGGLLSGVALFWGHYTSKIKLNAPSTLSPTALAKSGPTWT